MTTITPGDRPNLADYHRILGNISGGVDSQAMLDVLVEAARAAGVEDRIVVVHADLGEEEWPQTLELAAEHAAHYGARFEVVRREVDGRPQGILEHLEAKARPMWPDAANRWCTSDHKRGPIWKLMTRLARELRESGTVTDGPVRILDVVGMRAEESPQRAKAQPYAHKPRASTGRRHVDEWRPLHYWTKAQVWERVTQAGTRPHPAYAAGMSRLSCRFCVLASRADLILSVRLNPDLAAKYAAVEARTGHRFRRDLSMAEIIEAAARTSEPEPWRQLSLLDSDRLC
jgi:3'-phosphoadenosine 5'-phosphosulfate sulfotransferase (PAPS reductase)/FAD synthetase